MSRRSRPRTTTATLADVARAADVSMATASRVLSGSSYGVAEELRARVLAAAAELDYVVNAHARALARASSSTIGVVVHDIADPYFAEIVRGILEVATERDHLVTICHTGREPDRELEYLSLLRAQQAEAVILAASGRDDPDFAARLAQVVAPYTAAGGRIAAIGRHTLQADAVLADNVGGALALGRAVVARGHRDIGILSGPAGLTVNQDRMAGFARALEEAGLQLPGERIVHGDFSRDGGAIAMGQLMAQVPDLTAVFAVNDMMAIGALATLREAGVIVPDDLSLVGFDDIPMARDLEPPLATVRIPMAELGATAVRMALGDEDDAEAAPPRRVSIPVELVLRPSLGRPPLRRARGD
ncbi:MAG TPA: LacI family DNA-binding transcriptional regulator [Euzebya sp.]|nr:LacI family DNA-binding transcriptional regulator [Euzebya sp.]